MPAIQPLYDPNDKRLNQLGDDERTRRAIDIDRRWQWYNGRHPDTLKAVPGQMNDNVKLNLCGRAVDRLVEFIGRPDAFVLDTPHGAGDESAAALDGMNALYDAQILPLLPEVALEAMVSGHAFVKLWDDDSSGAQCSVIDSRMMTVYWHAGAGSRRLPLWYRAQWADSDARGQEVVRRQDIVPRALIDGGAGWTIYEYEGRGARFYPVGEAAWAYDFAPVVEFRNRVVPWEYYGQSQLSDDVIQLNQTANFLATNTARIIRYHAHPRTIAIGVKAEQIEATSVDGMFVIPSGAQVQNLEMQSDLGASMAMLQQIKSEFFATVRVADVSSYKDRLGQITNFGVRMLYSDMLEQIEEKRDSWGVTAGHLLLRLCEINGVRLDRVPYPQWPVALPENRLEKLQAAQIEQALGVVSRETLAGVLGRNWTVERRRIGEE